MPVFTGTNADNNLFGTDLNDLLNGLGGADHMTGGKGNDTYIVDNARDVVVEYANQGHDLVQSSVSYALGANIEDLKLVGTADLNATGNALDNTLTGNDGDNTIDGGAGADRMVGGKGWDVYYVDNVGDTVVEAAVPGDVDTVESSVSILKLYDNVENLALLGSADLNAFGNNLDNMIIGNAGANRIDGGVGADLMAGGKGDDTYVIDNVNDRVSENGNQGIDTILSSVSHLLEANVENLTLTGTGNISALGNALDNILIGNSGNNTLSGGAGSDTMIGGKGDDTYVVENAGDKVVEYAGGGTDTIFTAMDYSLLGHENVENLHLTGSVGLHGTGNELNNAIVGTSGNDVIDGGIGADSMIGGGGDDTYYVDNAGDIVNEALHGGAHDTVVSSVALTQGWNNVEDYVFQTAEDVNFKSDGVDNFIAGGSGNDHLDGWDGNDTIHGGAGDDVLYGGGGDDILFGDGGADSLQGSTGNDTYYIDDVHQKIEGEWVNSWDGTADLVYSSVDFTLPDYVEIGVLTGHGNTNLSGSVGDNKLTGNDGNNILNGHEGNDILIGGKGSDTFGFDLAPEGISQNVGNVDTIKDFVKAEDVLQIDHVKDQNGDGQIALDDLLASVSKVVDHGAGNDVQVFFNNDAHNSIVFSGVGTGHVDQITDLVSNVTTQIHVS